MRTANMSRLSFCLILIHCVTAPVFGNFIQALIGDTVVLSTASLCKETHRVNLALKRDDNDPVPVASRHDGGVWRPEPGYEDRMEPGINATLRSVNINDGGVYEFTCTQEKDDIKLIQVDVVQFQVVDVTEGASVTLPCYHKTSGSDEAAMWERKPQERVLKLKFSSNQTEYGAGLERRASLSPDAFKQGNLSLILETRLEDDGDYFCFVVEKNDNKKRGSPAAVRLKVRPVQTRTTTTSTTPAPPETEHPAQCIAREWSILTIVLTSLVCGPLFFMGGWMLTRCKQRSQDDGKGNYNGVNDNVQLSSTNNQNAGS